MARPKGIPAHNRRNLIEQKFNRLTVIGQAPSRPCSGTTMGYWLCRCECGKEVEVTTGKLTGGHTKSCGCLKREVMAGNTRATTHGHAGTPTWKSWAAMLKRCRDGHTRYGGRGIVVDPRWESFENFFADMGERPNGHTLDRIDNDGPYALRNCRWALPVTQSNNRGNNRWISHDGRTQTVAQWAREIGVARQTLTNRLNQGWPIEEALSTRTVYHRRRTPSNLSR